MNNLKILIAINKNLTNSLININNLYETPLKPLWKNQIELLIKDIADAINNEKIRKGE